MYREADEQQTWRRTPQILQIPVRAASFSTQTTMHRGRTAGGRTAGGEQHQGKQEDSAAWMYNKNNNITYMYIYVYTCIFIHPIIIHPCFAAEVSLPVYEENRGRDYTENPQIILGNIMVASFKKKKKTYLRCQSFNFF